MNCSTLLTSTMAWMVATPPWQMSSLDCVKSAIRLASCVGDQTLSSASRVMESEVLLVSE